MEYKYYWEDYQKGDRVFAGTISVDKAEIMEFANKYDPQPFHNDEAMAENSIYGGLIASGWHTCSLLMRVMYDSFLKNSASLGSPGLETLQWLGPVRPDQELSVYRQIEESRESKSKPDRGLVKTRWTIEDNSGQTLLILVGMNFFLKRPT